MRERERVKESKRVRARERVKERERGRERERERERVRERAVPSTDCAHDCAFTKASQTAKNLDGV